MRYVNPAHILHRIFKIREELGEIYLNLTILAFAMSLVAIFIPVYLLIIGFSLVSVLYFAVIEWTVEGLLSPFIGSLASKIGFKYTIFWRSPTLIILLGLITLLDPTYGLNILGSSLEIPVLTGLGVLFGFSGAVYWTLINAEFVKYSEAIHEGEEIGYLYTLMHIVAIIAPFVGGLILTSLGFGSLFLIVSFLIIFSLSPLFMLKEYKGSIKFKLSDTKLFMNKYLALFFALDGILIFTENYLWPVYIFTTLRDVLSVGLAGSFSGIGIAIITIFIGKLTDRINKKSVIKAGAIFYALIWVARIFATTPLEIFMLSFLGGLVYILIAIPVYALFCDYARKSPIIHSIFREVWLVIGRLLTLTLLIGVIFFSVAGLEVAFIAAGLASLFLILVVNRFKE